ncbi:hypothetical protein [Nonomuraea sp. NPDC049784]|uniref:hypothetical protein n=1 Tax=Nonomuraea sp. NPDC049784 TaxID=3154361 RepID=UPI0033DC9F21
MSETIAGVVIPDSPIAAEATSLVRETTTPLLFHHSRRVFVFGSLQARGQPAEALGHNLDPVKRPRFVPCRDRQDC